MVSHGLATHEQPDRYLRVRQPLREQPEHFLLSRCQDPDASAAGPRRDAESPQECRDPIGVESGAELLVRRLGATCVLDGEVRALAGADHREHKVDLRPLVREPQVGPCGQRAFQNSGCRARIIGCGSYQPTRSQRSGHSPRLPGRFGQAFEPGSSQLSCNGISSGQPSFHQESECRPQQRLMAAEQLEPLFEQMRRPSPVTFGQPERCPDKTRLLVALELVVELRQKPLRFLEPPLPDAQADQPAQCAGVKTRAVIGSGVGVRPQGRSLPPATSPSRPAHRRRAAGIRRTGTGNRTFR